MEEDDIIAYNNEEEEENLNHSSKIQSAKLKPNEEEEDIKNSKSEMDEENVRDIFEMEFDSIEDWMSNELGQLKNKCKANVFTLNIQTPQMPSLKQQNSIANID